MEQRWHSFFGGEIIWKLFNGGIELELGFISHPSACLAFKVCARWTHITHWPTLKFDLSKRCRSNRVSAVTALSANAAFHAGFCWLAKRNVYFMMMSFPRASNSGGTRGECQWDKRADETGFCYFCCLRMILHSRADRVSFLGLIRDSWSDKSQFKHLYNKDKHQMVDTSIHQVP